MQQPGRKLSPIEHLKDRGCLLLTAITFPIWLPLVILALVLLPFLLIAQELYGCWLRRLYEAQYGASDRRILFIYSDSPNWKAYIETNIIPKIEPHAVILDWSKRKEWPKNAVTVRMFKHFAGDEDYNPMAIIVPKNGPIKTIRLWAAFRDAKHGNTENLKKQEVELYSALAQLSRA